MKVRTPLRHKSGLHRWFPEPISEIPDQPRQQPYAEVSALQIKPGRPGNDTLAAKSPTGHRSDMVRKKHASTNRGGRR